MKTRFAPSPTGLLQLGNVRVALFNYLLAHKENGTMLLRIEDTDQVRSKSEYVTALMEDLHWLGIKWNEGPVFQSKSFATYEHYYQILQDLELAYPCFCTQQALQVVQKLQRSHGELPHYPGTCRNLKPNDISLKLEQGLTPTLRFRIQRNQVVKFIDLLKGVQEFNTNVLGDFIIRRQDLTPSFMFANAIDDAVQFVTHAIRGEDHLTNTPRQLLILRALQLHEPQYGHLPLILGEDGQPLSKRNGSRNINDLRNAGFLPQAILNHVVRLAHPYPTNDCLGLDKLAEQFNLHKINAAPAKHSEQQLLFWQTTSVHALMPTELYSQIPAEYRVLLPKGAELDFCKTIGKNINFVSEVKFWLENIYGNVNFDINLVKTSGFLLQAALSYLQENPFEYQALIAYLKQTLRLSGKALFTPLRLAITNQEHGPELAQLFLLLGKERVMEKITTVLGMLHAKNI